MLVAISSIDKMQDFVRWSVSQLNTPLFISTAQEHRKSAKPQYTTKFISGGTVIAEERKLTATMSQLSWALRHHSDYVFVDHGQFLAYCNDKHYQRLSTQVRKAEFNKAVADMRGTHA